MKRLVIAIVFFVIGGNASAQARRIELDEVLLSNICVEGFCFGSSVEKMLQSFGQPDTVMFYSSGDYEFAEPAHNIYYYSEVQFYEILYPGLSQGLIYGCSIYKNNATVSFSGVNLVIGVTRLDELTESYPKSVSHVERISERESCISMCPKIPLNFSSVDTAFIDEIRLYFTDGVLRKVWTRLDRN